jgi:hypothetical protein
LRAADAQSNTANALFAVEADIAVRLITLPGTVFRRTANMLLLAFGAPAARLAASAGLAHTPATLIPATRDGAALTMTLSLAVPELSTPRFAAEEPIWRNI